MTLLYVTSFTPAIFRASGRRLVDSFLASQTPGRLLVCHEGFSGPFPVRGAALRSHPIGASALLRDWLAANRDIIPPRFGGAAPVCHCPDPADPLGVHAPGCHAGWYNYNAARWFRKVVALHYALRRPSCDAYVWLDADCVFTARLPDTEVQSWFGRSAVFYLKGPGRQVVESGVLGIRNSPTGRRFIQAAVDRYRSGDFRRDPRWDDGYQFQMTLLRHPEISRTDLAVAASKNLDVVPYSPVRPYLRHDKGTHAVALRLVPSPR